MIERPRFARHALAVLAALAGCSCASVDADSTVIARGNASGSMRVGVFDTTTTTQHVDGSVVTVREICGTVDSPCEEREAVGESNEAWAGVNSVVAAFLSIASIVIQALR